MTKYPCECLHAAIEHGAIHSHHVAQGLNREALLANVLLDGGLQTVEKLQFR